MYKLLLSCAAAIAFIPAASAQTGNIYIGGSVGAVDQSDSDNAGKTGAFTTGNLGDGSTLDVAAGTDYGWNTAFDSGEAFSVEVGKRYGNGVRLALEAVGTSADVDTHTDVTLGGGAIGALDAAAIAGSADPLGVTIADVVADGRGEISQTAFFLNGYYDFNAGNSFQPYIGLGLGLSDVEVDYRPSDIAVISDSETVFAYQVKGGVTLALNNPFEIYGEAVYRATSDIETNNDLLSNLSGLLRPSNSKTISPPAYSDANLRS